MNSDGCFLFAVESMNADTAKAQMEISTAHVVKGRAANFCSPNALISSKSEDASRDRFFVAIAIIFLTLLMVSFIFSLLLLRSARIRGGIRENDFGVVWRQLESVYVLLAMAQKLVVDAMDERKLIRS